MSEHTHEDLDVRKSYITVVAQLQQIITHRNDSSVSSADVDVVWSDCRIVGGGWHVVEIGHEPLNVVRPNEGLGGTL